MGLWGTLILNAPLAVGAYGLAAGGLRLPDGPSRLLGAAVLGWTWISLGMVLLGSFGALQLVPLTGWSCLLMAIGVMGSLRGSRGATGPRVAERGFEVAVVIATALVLVPCVILGVASLVGPVKVVSDGPIYHLYFAARWWWEGRLIQVPVPFGENAATYFPAVGDLWFAWLMIGWGGDRLAKVGQAPFLLLAAVAAFSLARRAGASRGAAATATAWFLTSTPLLLFSFEPNVDTIFVAGYLAAAVFFVRHADGRQPVGSLALGALAAGCAWGTKPTGTVFVPPLLALVGFHVLRRGPIGRRVRDLALLVLLPIVPAGFWFARNAWQTGNPLYPLDVSTLGWVGWYGSSTMSQGSYYLPMQNLSALGDTLLAVLDPRLVLIWVAAMLVTAWRPGREAGHVRLASALALANVALYWILVPYRTQQRFFLQALGLAAVPLAVFFDRNRILQGLGLVLLALHVFTAQNWPFSPPRQEPPWDLSPIIPNAIPAPTSVEGDPPLMLAVLFLACCVAAAAWEHAWRRPSVARVALALVISVTLFAGRAYVRSELRPDLRSDEFYPVFRDYYRGWLALERASGPAGARVAYAGTNIPYYLMGRGLRNEVRYINVDRHRDWLMHDYHREAVRAGRPHWTDYPRPGWDRARPDFDAWLANLRAAGIELLVVTHVNPAEGPHNVADAAGFPIEARWAAEHPEIFRPLYGIAEQDPLFRLYRVSP